jgi:glucokinase
MKYAIGVDIGGTSIKYSLVGEDGSIRKKEAIRIDKKITGEETISRLGRALNDYIASLGVKVEGIGVGCPGAINSTTGTCDYSSNLHWNKLPIVVMLKSITGLPVKIANDANVAAFGEYAFGSAKGYKNVVLVTLGTGVGGGLVLDGNLFEGKDGKGAELGHMIIEEGGRECSCGLHGCLEAYASVTALAKATREAMEQHPETKMIDYAVSKGGRIDGRTAFETAKLGDKTAIEVREDYLDHLATGLINLCNIFRPDIILLSGGLSNQKEELTEPLRERLAAKHFGFKRTSEVLVKVASLGDLTGIYGAAALILK